MNVGLKFDKEGNVVNDKDQGPLPLEILIKFFENLPDNSFI